MLALHRVAWPWIHRHLPAYGDFFVVVCCQFKFHQYTIAKGLSILPIRSHSKSHWGFIGHFDRSLIFCITSNWRTNDRFQYRLINERQKIAFHVHVCARAIKANRTIHGAFSNKMNNSIWHRTKSTYAKKSITFPSPKCHQTIFSDLFVLRYSTMKDWLFLSPIINCEWGFSSDFPLIVSIWYD